jgi:hypothetical protein
MRATTATVTGGQIAESVVNEVHAAFHALDPVPLDLLATTLAARDPLTWSMPYAHMVAVEYRRFLALCSADDISVLVPPEPVDLFWHAHLGSGRYETYFAAAGLRTVAHRPGLGSTPDTAAEWSKTWTSSLSVWETVFPESRVFLLATVGAHCSDGED